MANFPPLENPTNLAVPLDRAPRSKALTTAERIRHTDHVPGTTDNDGDSWRKHLQAQDAQNAGDIADLQAATRDLHDVGEPGTWGTADDGTLAVHDARSTEIEPGAPPSDAFDAAAATFIQTVAEPQPAGGNRTPRVNVVVQVPDGADVSDYRVFRDNVGDGTSSSGVISSNRWTHLAGGTFGYPSGFDYYEVYAGAVGAWTTVTWTLQKHSDEIHHTEFEGVVTGSIEDGAVDEPAWRRTRSSRIVVVPDADDLPPLDDFDARAILLWRNEFYHKGELPVGESFSFRSATFPGPFVQRGVERGLFGQFHSNPDGNFFGLYDDGSVIELLIDRAAYRTAKGGDEADGDAITVAMTTSEDTPRTQSLPVDYISTWIEDRGRDYLVFQGSRSGTILDAALNGHDVSVALTRGDDAFMQVAGSDTYEAWVPVELGESQRVKQELEDLLHRIQTENPPNEARLQAVEDKVSHVDFDDAAAVWQSNPNTAVGGKHPYGGWAWIPRGGNATRYAGQDYDDFVHAGGAGFAGTGSGLLWVLPNNINWSHVRLVVRRRDGGIRTIVTGQSLRNAPASLTVDNLPASPPDVTVRWSASSDTHAFAVSNIEATDTIALEVLGSAHVPVWGGEVDGDVDRGQVGGRALADILGSLQSVPHLEERIRDLESKTADIFFDEHIGWTAEDNTAVGGLYPYGGWSWISGGRAFYTSKDYDSDFDHAGGNAPLTLGNGIIWVIPDNVNRGRVRLVVRERNGAVKATVLAAAMKPLPAVLDGASTRIANQPASTTAYWLERGDGSPYGVGDFQSGDTVSLQVFATTHTPLWQGDVIGEVEELASRRAITGGWLIASPHRLDKQNSITQSGTTLQIDALAAAASDTLGIIVEVTRTGHHSKIFVPWAMFRTGSGTYVTGALVAVTQGYLVGFWTDNANSALFAQLAYDNANGLLDLTISGANTDGNSILRVWSAK